MNRLQVLYHLVLGDFRERTRRYSFLWILVGTTFFGYLVITGKYTMIFLDYQTELTSAWVGTLMAMFCTLFLAIVGFYLVRKTVERDRRTGVGQILAATPMSNLTYLSAKFISNYLVLAACASILVGAAVFMQMLGSFAGGFNPLDLLVPFVVLTLPVLFMVAGLAVVFECVRWLRGSVGNVLYLMIFEALMIQSIAADRAPIDLIGASQFTSSVKQAIHVLYPGVEVGIQVGLIDVFESAGQAANMFTWPGIDWSIGVILPRLGYMAVGLFLVGLVTLKFNRFDPAKTKIRRKKRTKEQHGGGSEGLPATSSSLSYRQLKPIETRFSMIRMIFAELRLMLKGYHWVWYAVAAGIAVAQFAAPFEIARRFLLPAALIWPLPVWSAMGTRELRFHTTPLLMSSASPLMRRTPTVWLCGVIVAALSVSGMIAKSAMIGDATLLGTLLMAILFMPTAAFLLGSLTGSRKFFEVIYMMIWYIGCVNRLGALDFAGVTAESIESGTPLTFLAVSLTLLLLLWPVNVWRLKSH
jgi:hypothetical protein